MQTTEERQAFLVERQKGIGGSDIAAICGVDPYRSPFDVYLEKTRPPDLSDPANIHMLRGLLLEDVAAELYSEASGNKVRRVGQRAHGEHPWAIVNADRQILSSNGKGTGALEIKSPMTRTFSDIIAGGMKDPYILQLQWALFVTGYSWGEFCAINLEHGAGPIIYFPVERNDELINLMLTKAESFWFGHVEPRLPPTPDMWKGGEPLQVPEHSGEAVTLGSPEVVELAQAVMFSWKQKKLAEEAYKDTKKAATKFMREIEATKIHVPEVGKLNYVWQPGRVQFNSKALKAYGAVDPDKLRYALVDEYAMESSYFEEILRECGLDFEQFEKQGNAYQQFTPYPAKGAK
jgi:putative phage-type endonuclease